MSLEWWLCHQCRPSVSVALLLDLFSSTRNQLQLLDIDLVSAAFVDEGKETCYSFLHYPFFRVFFIHSFVRSFIREGDTRRLLVCLGDTQREGRSFVALDCRDREHVDCPALLTFIERSSSRERAFTCQCDTLKGEGAIISHVFSSLVQHRGDQRGFLSLLRRMTKETTASLFS